jgi:hypothetical protein
LARTRRRYGPYALANAASKLFPAAKALMMATCASPKAASIRRSRTRASVVHFGCAGHPTKGSPCSVIGFLNSRSPGEAAVELGGFRKGLADTGIFDFSFRRGGARSPQNGISSSVSERATLRRRRRQRRVVLTVWPGRKSSNLFRLVKFEQEQWASSVGQPSRCCPGGLGPG